MDFLEKLDTLIEQKGINKNILARESGIPYTTIDAFYKKGYSNAKLSTIKKLCAYFGVTLDYFMRDDVSEIEYSENKYIEFAISPLEKEIILAYRKTDAVGQAIVLRSLGVDDAKNDARMA